MYTRFVVSGYKHAQHCPLFLSICVYPDPGCLPSVRQNLVQPTSPHTTRAREAPWRIECIISGSVQGQVTARGDAEC